MNKGRLIFITDLLLLPVFLFCLYTGVRLHVAGHDAVVAVIRLWSMIHLFTSLVFLSLVSLHVNSHWAWYRTLKNGCKGRKKMVLFLSLAFLLLALSGFSLYLFPSGDAHPGLWHYKLGLLFGVLAILHILKRRKFFFSKRGQTVRKQN